MTQTPPSIALNEYQSLNNLYSIFCKDSQNVTKRGVIFDCDLMVCCMFFYLSSSLTAKETNEYAGVQLNQLNVSATLGVGGFGRVELVSISSYIQTNIALYNIMVFYYVLIW